jgi:hypothetical protein
MLAWGECRECHVGHEYELHQQTEDAALRLAATIPYSRATATSRRLTCLKTRPS